MTDPEDSMSGSVLYAAGLPSVVRIPIPRTNGLCIELTPRGRIPKGGSTSTLFFQDMAGKRQLRLDYGYNAATKTVNYHWNQSRVYDQFGIPDHTEVGEVGRVTYQAAKYFRYAGRAFVLIGVGIDIASIVRSSTPLRRASEVASAWTLAWVGCRAVGAGGAAVGSLASPIGTAVGGIGGCIIGGYAGYQVGDYLGATVYDWGHSFFTPLPQTDAP